MHASFLIDDLEKAKKLPLGHYDRSKAEKAVAREYEKCYQNETRWAKVLFKGAWKRYRRVGAGYFSFAQALELCNFICDSLGQHRINNIIYRSKEVQPGAQAHYDGRKREIHVAHSVCFLTTLVHELAHHFDAHDHGAWFVEVENTIFPLALEWLRKL